MLRSRLCDYSDVCILAKGTITDINIAAQSQANHGANEKVVLKNCASFSECIRRIKNTQLDDDIVMTMYNGFNAENITNSFNLKEKTTGKTGGNGTKDV